MRYAIVSDLHANWQAWTSVLEDIKQHQADAIICLGDIVGYGPRPEEVLSSVRNLTQNFVIGNHDAAACGLLDASIFNDHAREVVNWTAQKLSPESHAFLQQVPLTIETEDILFVHAEIQQPGRFGYIESDESALHHMMFTEASIAFIGHTHKPLAYRFNDESCREMPDKDFHLAPGHRYLVNVGSAGEPRHVDDIRARYVIYDSSSRAIYFRKVRFDAEAYRADLQAVGLNIKPYFLSMIDHEASQGRDVFERLDDHMMAVPEKSLFTGGQTSKQEVVASDIPEMLEDEFVPQATPSSPSVDSGAAALMEEFPNPPPPVEDFPEETPPQAQKPPTPAEPPKSNINTFIFFLMLVILAGLAIALFIIIG